MNRASACSCACDALTGEMIACIACDHLALAMLVTLIHAECMRSAFVRVRLSG